MTGKIYFEYDSSFLADPLWLSPFKLPPKPGLIEHREREFGPLPGLFDDSLPDGWGLLLMDRFFQQQQIRPADVGPLDRLAFLGKRTLGALTYHPPSEEAGTPQPIHLHQLAVASAEILRGRSSDVLPQLLRAGGSPGGARRGQHTTTIGGEGKNPSRRQLLDLGQEAGISAAAAEEILDAVLAAVAEWNEHAKTLGVGKRRRIQIESVLASHRASLS